jgi:proline iminopeptidase
MGLHPEIEPYDHGMVDGGDATASTGRPPAIRTASPRWCCTAGPGSGAVPFFRRSFEPAAYRIVLV